MKMYKRLIPLALALTLLAGCAQGGGGSSSQAEEEVYIDRVVMQELEIENEAVALVSSPVALSNMLVPEASGKLEKKNGRAVIDYSNTGDGYVMVQFTGTTEKRLKVLVQGPSYSTDLKLQYSYDQIGRASCRERVLRLV